MGEKNPALGRALLERVPPDLRQEAQEDFDDGRIKADPAAGLAQAAKQASGNREKILQRVVGLLK